MHAFKLKENNQIKSEQKKSLIREFDPRDHEEKEVEVRLKELVHFASMALFSFSLIILNYLFLMVLPVFLSLPLAFLGSFSLILLAKKFLQKN
ncbi:DUF3270 family protein [Streptococcaceae bacterium ESL0729]|nr:DUF3270 family protein [Streptococcaceae bacterium ESL0729]